MAFPNSGKESTTNNQLQDITDVLYGQCQLSKVIMEQITAGTTALVIAAFVIRQAALSTSRYQLLNVTWLSTTSLIITYSDSTLP